MAEEFGFYVLTAQALRRIVDTALDEDAPWGDITGNATIPVDQIATAQFVAREDGVMSSGLIIAATFLDTEVEILIEDKQIFAAGTALASVTGSLRSILLGERVALNLLQRACGIATLTHRFVEAIEGTKARIVDTRKTTPGLRALEKAAVVDGGGYNHRYSLSDAVMVKDNHIAGWRARGLDVTQGLKDLKTQLGHTIHIEVEVDDLPTLDMVLAAEVADSVLLDNFSLADVNSAITQVDGRCLIEVSGGINLSTVADIAATGVDIISVGALTHSVRAIDIGLDIANP